MLHKTYSLKQCKTIIPFFFFEKQTHTHTHTREMKIGLNTKVHHNSTQKPLEISKEGGTTLYNHIISR